MIEVYSAMVIDASAVVAVLLGEPEAARLTQAIAADGKRLISPVSVLEAALAIETRKGPSGGRELDLFLHAAKLEVFEMNLDQVELARSAYARFGKGHHPARLNLGDCCSYALANYTGEPLLCKGADFPQTDIPLVRW